MHVIKLSFTDLSTLNDADELATTFTDTSQLLDSYSPPCDIQTNAVMISIKSQLSLSAFHRWAFLSSINMLIVSTVDLSLPGRGGALHLPPVIFLHLTHRGR